VGQPAAAVSKTSGYRSRPLQVTWEVTNSINWKPVSPRSRAAREFQQFSTAEGFHLIEQIADMHVPLLALTGGDPLGRPDLLPLIEFASERSLRTSLTVLPMVKIEPGITAELKARGLMRAAFWLNGSTPGLHDHFWGMPGLYRRTMEAIGLCHEVQMPVQVNTMLSRRNFQNLDPMIELLTRLDVSLWHVFFYVPPKREEAGEMLNADEHEEVFAKLYAASRRRTSRSRPPKGSTINGICYSSGCGNREENSQKRLPFLTLPEASMMGKGSYSSTLVVRHIRADFCRFRAEM